MVLKQRIITGVTLAILLIAADLLLPRLPLAILFGLVVAISAWEWSSLIGLRQAWLRPVYALSFVIAMPALYLYCGLDHSPVLERVQPVLGLAGLWWAIALLWVRSYPFSQQIWGTRPMLALMGWLVLLPPWLAVIYLLHYDSGRLLVIAMIATVAFADIGAYFTGKRFGRRKLAVEVSPGKSWEGFAGGMGVCLLLALALGFTVLPEQLTIGGLVAIVGATALASVLGDLVESMVKRHRGVKDSGTLLPGHGGFLDRIDGITAAAPVFVLGLILAGWQP